MRIIAGEYRGRRIEGPLGNETRPMLDRVREALFSTLGELVEEALVLDLFAGTGSLGLEALSRGARRARCVERNARTLAILSANARSLGCSERVEASAADALSPLAWQRPEAERYDLVFFDPPYPAWRDPKLRPRLDDTLRTLIEEHTQPEAVLVVHAPRKGLDEQDFSPAWQPRCRVYGSTALWYLETPELADVHDADVGAREESAEEA